MIEVIEILTPEELDYPQTILAVNINAGEPYHKGETLLLTRSEKTGKEYKIQSNEHWLIHDVHVSRGQRLKKPTHYLDCSVVDHPFDSRLPADCDYPLQVLAVLVQSGKPFKKGETMLLARSEKTGSEVEVTAQKNAIVEDVMISAGQRIVAPTKIFTGHQVDFSALRRGKKLQTTDLSAEGSLQQRADTKPKTSDQHKKTSGAKPQSSDRGEAGPIQPTQKRLVVGAALVAATISAAVILSEEKRTTPSDTQRATRPAVTITTPKVTERATTKKKPAGLDVIYRPMLIARNADFSATIDGDPTKGARRRLSPDEITLGAYAFFSGNEHTRIVYQAPAFQVSKHSPCINLPKRFVVIERRAITEPGRKQMLGLWEAGQINLQRDNIGSGIYYKSASAAVEDWPTLLQKHMKTVNHTDKVLFGRGAIAADGRDPCKRDEFWAFTVNTETGYFAEIENR